MTHVSFLVFLLDEKALPIPSNRFSLTDDQKKDQPVGVGFVTELVSCKDIKIYQIKQNQASWEIDIGGKDKACLFPHEYYCKKRKYYFRCRVIPSNDK